MNGELIKILLPAVGGQGGGVLTEWLFQAFLLEGYEVQGISLPGLSQRGGSTVYYLEVCADKTENGNILFSQHPVPGDVDVIVAQEFLELGRIIEQGYSSEKTTIISSTHRIFSTLEKLPVGSGVYSERNLQDLANEFSLKFIGMDVLDIVKNNSMDERSINAVLLGAVASSGCLPLEKKSYIEAIGKVGVAVENNIKAFEIGYSNNNIGCTAENPVENNRYFDGSLLETYRVGDEEIKKLQVLLKPREGVVPEHLKCYLHEAVLRLTDYQSEWYAEKYMNALDRIIKIDSENTTYDFRLTGIVLKNLALLMSYEDGIRVAELKTRWSRFRRIKKEMNIDDSQVFNVVDYLKPDSGEIYGLMPDIIVSPVLSLLQTGLFRKLFGRKEPLTFEQTPTTSSIGGFLSLWLLTRLKFIRPYSYRYKKEHSIIERYIDSVEFYAKKDYEVGCIVARAGSVIKGYGRVRRRTMDTFSRFIDNVIKKVFVFADGKGYGYETVREAGIRSLELISGDENGIVRAEEVASAITAEKRFDG